MVPLTEVHSSNAQISSSLPTGLVAVFVGATAGIGEMTLKEFVKHTRQPRVYFSGRSQEAGDRITAECRALNAEGEFIFTKADLSLIRSVDDLCREIKSKEKAINLLFMSIGSLVFHTETSEGLHFGVALPHYSRARFIVNLLPLIQQATNLRRVVSVAGGSKEGTINVDDLDAWKIPLLGLRPHMASIITLSLEAIAKSAPDVTFIHEFPGPVKTNLGKDASGLFVTVLKALICMSGFFINIPGEECAARHLYIATSARYPASTGAATTAGIPLEDGAAVARGTTGGIGSGVYSIDWDGESASPKVEALLAKYREEGMVETVWNHVQDEYKRITGVAYI